MARCSIRGAVTEENLKSVRRVRRSGDCGGGWRVDKKPWWKLRRWWGERIEGFGNRFHPRGKPPSFASYVLFEKRSLFYREKKSVRPRSLFFSSPLPLSSPPFLLFSSPRVSAVFFSYPLLLSLSLSLLRLFLPPLLFLSRSLSSLFLSLSLSPLGSAWMNEKRIRFCVLRETGFFPTLNYKTALQLFFPGARYFSFFRSL